MKPFQNLFSLKKPCQNCPFLKEGAIELRPGRLESIIEGLIKDDQSTFHCHKTVHNEKTGGTFENGQYEPSNYEAICAGSMIYLEKAKRPSVMMRLGRCMKLYSKEKLKKHYHSVIDPKE